MLLTIVYLLVRRVLGFAVLVFRKDLARDAELLGHGNAVLRRHTGRIRYERGLRAPRRHVAPRASRPRADPRRAASAGRAGRISGSLQTRDQGIAQRVPDAGRDIPLPAMTGPGTRWIRRKPVLSGLINEYTHAA